MNIGDKVLVTGQTAQGYIVPNIQGCLGRVRAKLDDNIVGVEFSCPRYVQRGGIGHTLGDTLAQPNGLYFLETELQHLITKTL